MKKGPRVRPASERFWSKVTLAMETDCLLWTGASSRNGYGRFQDDHNRAVGAHRWAYEAARGPIPDGLTIDHLCREKLCVRPDHLEAVTQAENWWRWYEPKSHCPQGHELIGDNLIQRRTRNGRECRTCDNDRQRRGYYEAKKAMIR